MAGFSPCHHTMSAAASLLDPVPQPIVEGDSATAYCW